MNALLSAGILVFAFAIGCWATRKLLAPRLGRSLLARHALGLAFGLAMLTPPMVLLAAIGSFRTAWIGSLGWLGSVLVAATWRKSAPGRARQLDAPELVVLLAASIFLVVAATGRDETLGGGRDQQIYAEFAVALSEHGTFDLRYAPLDDADKALLRYGYKAEACSAPAFKTINSEHRESPFVVPGGVNACDGVDHPIGLLHPSGWPVWLAVIHSVFGIEGLYRANAAIFALGGLVFFCLARLLTRSVIALGATLVLFSLPSTLWIGGISLSEPLAMTLLLGVPLFAVSKKRCHLSVGVVVLAASLARIDAAIAAPLIMAAAVAAGLAAPAPASIAAARRIVWSQGAALAAALVVYMTLFPRYFDAAFEYYALICATSAILIVFAMLITPAFAVRAGAAMRSRSVRVAAISVLAILFIYAAAIRPTLQPFSIIRDGLSLDGMRDFREESVRNLAAYLSWPLVIATVLGVGWSIWHRWSNRVNLLRPVVLFFAIAPAVLYLSFPYISADHPWAFRRFIPIVVPYALLFAALFVNECTRCLGRVGPVVGAAALLLPAYVLVVSKYPPGVLLMRENDGLTTQIAAIARQLPDELIVADDVQQDIGSALFVAFGKPVAVANGGLYVTGNPEQITKWIDAKAKSGHAAWLLHSPDLWRTGAKWSNRHAWWVTRQVIEPSFVPPATTIKTHTSQIVLSRVDGLDHTFAARMFGAERIWGAREEGFFGTEVAPFGMFRYTNGDAWIEVPSAAIRDADALKVDVFTFAKEGVRRWLRVRIDGQVVWTGDVRAGLETVRVPAVKPALGDLVRIELQSERADIADMSAHDPRAGLSVGLVGIRPLRKDDLAAAGLDIHDFRAELEAIDVKPQSLQIPANGAGDFVLDIRNCGTAYWPTRRELGVDSRSVQIALRWRARGRPNEVVADNRWPMMISLFAGDRTRIRVPLRPIAASGEALPPGEYDVDVEMVREPGEFFSKGRDAPLSIPVVIASPRRV